MPASRVSPVDDTPAPVVTRPQTTPARPGTAHPRRTLSPRRAGSGRPGPVGRRAALEPGDEPLPCEAGANGPSPSLATAAAGRSGMVDDAAPHIPPAGPAQPPSTTAAEHAAPSAAADRSRRVVITPL